MNKRIPATATLLLVSFFVLANFPSRASSEETPNKKSITLYEKGVQIQFLSGQLTDENNHLHMEPVFLTYGFKINSLLRLEGHKGTFQFILAPFFSPITSPRASVAFGANIAFRYSYPLSKKITVFCEGGAAPMYFGLNTEEQGPSGFNFLDQAAVGFQYFFKEDQAIGIGYRKIHISNLQLTDDNSGINGDAGFVSFSKFF